MSQRDVASKLGCTQAAIQYQLKQLRSASKIPKVSKISKLSKIPKVSKKDPRIQLKVNLRSTKTLGSGHGN